MLCNMKGRKADSGSSVIYSAGKCICRIMIAGKDGWGRVVG